MNWKKAAKNSVVTNMENMGIYFEEEKVKINFIRDRKPFRNHGLPHLEAHIGIRHGKADNVLKKKKKNHAGTPGRPFCTRKP